MLRGLLRRALATVAATGHDPSATFLVTDGELGTDALGGVGHLPQRGSGFEARLLNALDEVAARGFDRLVVVGSDTPEMRPADVRSAIDVAPGTVTLGPSRDGGVYLLGLDRADLPQLAGLPWCTPALLAELAARLRHVGRPLHLLTPRRDVDDTGDVARLRPLLDRLCRQLLGQSPFAPVRLPGRDDRPAQLAFEAHAAAWGPRGPPAPRGLC